MRQSSLIGFEKCTKKTRKEKFLGEMDPTNTLVRTYPGAETLLSRSSRSVRRTKGQDRMLRIDFMQHWFNLPDPGMEEALYDSQVPDDRLHGEETRVRGDSAYAGQMRALNEIALQAREFAQHRTGRHRALYAHERSRNRTKSRVRTRVEHVFHVLKCRFGYTRVRYRRLEQNANHLFAALAQVSLVIAKQQ